MNTEENDNRSEGSEEEQNNVRMDGPKTENYEYPKDYREKFIVDSDLPTKLSTLYEILGEDANKRYNYYFLNDKEILLSIASTFQIFNLETKERKINFSTEVGGIGAVTVHPSREYYAVGECGSFPNIYIYKYADGVSTLHRILRKGTECAFSALQFNEKGDLLASVGGEPDYNLVIWNWKSETIILKAKAFSQEVYHVAFSTNFEGKLITSGMGHIKFWEMAKTFTGLKLQGELGKFGQIDLSDISSFVEFPDGKVLSGTEHGTFLLWEGIFIKANLSQGENGKCHEGLVEHMSWELSEDVNEMKIMTAGHDGYVKWWKYLDIENVVLDDFSNGVIQPLKTVRLINPKNQKPIKIMNLVKYNNIWLIQDGNGYLIKVSPKENDEFDYEIISEFHSGPILKSTFVPGLPLIIAQGSDKRISIGSFASNMKFFPGRILLEDPLSADGLNPTACDIPKKENLDDPFILAVGYNTGLYRICSLNPITKQIDIIFEGRPHEEAITHIMFSPDGSYLCTTTKKEMFIFIIEQYDKIIPWCCIKQETLNIVDIDWHFDSKRILVGYSNGTLEEIEIPIHFDNTKTFILQEYTKKSFKLKLAENQIEKIDEKKRQRQKEQGKLKEEPEPGTVFSCKYIGLYQEDDFIVTSQKPFNEFLHLCTFNMAETNVDKRPVNFWKLPPGSDYYIKHISKNFIFLASHKGTVQIRNKKLIDKYVEVFADLPGCQITDISTSLDEKFVCICFEDGTTSVYALDTDGINMQIEMFSSGITEEKQNEINARVFTATTFEKQDIDSVIAQMKPGEFSPISGEKNPLELLSLENDKQQAQEREKERIANEKRQKLLSKVHKLQEDFEKLKTLNNRLPEEIRLTEDELIIDNRYLEIVEKEKKENLEDVEHKYNWLKAKADVMINKINTFFLSSVQTNKVTVYSLRTNAHVSTLRCPALPANFDASLKKLENDIEEFQKKIDFDSLIPKYLPLIESNKINEETERKKFEDALVKAENRKVSQSSKTNSKQVDIEPEIEKTKEDVKEIKELLDSKANLKEEIKDKEDKKKGDKKGTKDQRKRNEMLRIKCPEVYDLKIRYEKNYDEKTMLTNAKHKRRIYQFLKMLFEERQSFNKKIIDLKAEKIEIIEKLKGYKTQIDEYNAILSNDEQYDWFSFENKDTVQDLLSIPDEELNTYMRKKIEEDPELKEIYKKELEEQNKKNEGNSSDDEWNFIVKERTNKQINETNLQNELKRLNDMKYSYKKEKLLKEVNQLIDDFDAKVDALKNERTVVSFYQKLGEYELLMKHKELNKLRAFESEDKKFCDKLIKMFDEYTVNLENLKRNYGYMEENLKELKKTEEKKREKEIAFEKLIENERENREQLIKIFRQRKKEPSKDANGDDKLDQEEELNIPKSITNQIKHEIYNLRDGREYFDVEIQRYTNKIEDNKRKMETDIKAKEALDEKRAKLIEKIRQNEKQKEQYLNQIEFAMPIALDQFKKISPVDGRTLPELGKAIFITNSKVDRLINDLDEIEQANRQYEEEEKQFTADFDSKIKEKRHLEKDYREKETEFKNEQILKFGLEIDFNFLLQASKKTTVDRYENEYKKLKIESDRKIDAVKQKIADAKKILREETNNNTNQLTDIKQKLEEKQINDKKLEEKNSEITKKNNKKFVMYDLKEKKIKLKEILKLLKQQMDALKKEIDIFRRKGGHIYSTIASNLV